MQVTPGANAKSEAAMAEKEIIEDEYRKKVEELKKKEGELENDMANMWVLVAQLKREAGVGGGGHVVTDANVNSERNENVNEVRVKNGDFTSHCFQKNSQHGI